MDWFDLTALELGAKIQAGEVSAVDAARACLARIEEKEPTVHAFVTVTPEAALARRPMMGIDSCGMLISAVHHENGEEKLHLLMVDSHIPAGAKLY